MANNNLSKTPVICLIITYFCITLAASIIENNPIKGYEISVYTSTPEVWLLLGAVAVGGIIFTIYSISSRNPENNLWTLSLCAILLSNLLIVLIPYLRGYAFSNGGDHLSHFGWVKFILETGNLPTDNVYPITHILISQFSLILGVPPDITINFAGPLFYLLFVLFTYTLSREILPRNAAILAVTASTPLFCYYYSEVFPMGFAFLTFPLVFYLYFSYLKKRLVRFAIILMPFILLMPLFHPVAASMLVLSLLIYEISKFLFRTLPSTHEVCQYFSTIPVTLILPIISFIALVFWMWQNFPVWDSSISCMVNWFKLEFSNTPLVENAVESFNMLSLSTFEILNLFIKMYGHYFIYALLAFIGTLLTFKKERFGIDDYRKYLFLYSCFFLPAAFIWITDYIFPLTGLTSGRFIWLVAALFPPLVGFTLYSIIWSSNTNLGHLGFSTRILKSIHLRSGVVITILIVCSLLAMMAFYPSPYRHLQYNGVDQALIDGSSWILVEGNPEMDLFSIGLLPPYRVINALPNTNKELIRNYPPNSDKQVPDHFNYTVYNKLGMSFGNDCYLGAREDHIIELYTNLWPSVGRFTKNDFERLYNDNTANKIYENGEVQNWLVLSLAG